MGQYDGMRCKEYTMRKNTPAFIVPGVERGLMIITLASDDQPSIAMYFVSSTAGLSSFFGTLILRIPSSYFALISSWVTASPT